ncbi:MAG: helix-turn-helix transcriptional regulator [Saprospiraceae bacterium]|nr:helix-turn-helix transcriptional regulator [Saprospiraceae bacterium]
MYVTADDKGLSKNCSFHKENIVMYSSFQNLESKLNYKNFSIKYVIDGIENYEINGQSHRIKKGEFLLCNGTEEGKISIDQPISTRGICIGIESHQIAEALASHISPDSAVPEVHPFTFMSSPEFSQCQFMSKSSQITKVLLGLSTIIDKNPHDEYTFEKEFYFNVAESIVSDYIPLYRKIKSMQCIKLSTKKDLLQKLAKGKSFIEQYFTVDIDIKKVARESGISEYHFYRLFKNVYGISPYQYLKQKRLEMAK